jgi:integrase
VVTAIGRDEAGLPIRETQGALWTVPGSRMKAEKEHRVPLSEPARGVLAATAQLRRSSAPNAPLFPGGKGGKSSKGLSNTAMLMLLRRMNPHTEEQPARWRDPQTGEPIVPHGFRSTFKDWCAEATGYPRELAEAALAHALDSKVEAAYQRGDLLEKRRRLMNEWAAFCGRATAGDMDNVTTLHPRAENVA